MLRIRVAADLNDEDNKQICEVPAIPAARHDENGDICELKDVFEYVPCKVYRSEVPYDFAKYLITRATADAVGNYVADLNG